MKQHTYIIPYYEHNNDIHILLAKKKFYSKKDGYIHSNANQLVLIGGHLDKKYETDIVANIEKEFLEETGYKINKNKINLLQGCKSVCYYVGLYKCNNNEYNDFSDFNNLTKDNKFKELNDLIWVNIKNAKNIMQSHNSSLNISYMTNQFVYSYIENIKNDKPWYLLNELKKLYNEYTKIYPNITKKEIARRYIFPKIKNNDKKIINKVYKNIERHITKNSYYDWFIEAIDLFYDEIKNKTPKQKDIKKQDIKKQSPKQKRKYIPPHLRK